MLVRKLLDDFNLIIMRKATKTLKNQSINQTGNRKRTWEELTPKCSL